MKKLPLLSTLAEPHLSDYYMRVSAWLSSDRSDLAEGVLLCTALPQATVFTDYAIAYTAEKRRSEIVKYLTPLCPQACVQPSVIVSPSPGGTGSLRSSVKSGQSGISPLLAATTPSASAASGPASTFTTPAGTIYSFGPDGNVTAVGGSRPSHFDEWLDRMPADLQDKVSTLKDNFTHLVEYRRKVEALAADPNHSKSDLSRYARLAVAYEARNLNIFAQADLCWDELCGRPVSDDLKRELAEEERKLLKDLQHEDGVPTPSPSPSITADQAQKYIRDKFDPKKASAAQRKKAEQYAHIILKEKGKLSAKLVAKLAAAGIEV